MRHLFAWTVIWWMVSGTNAVAQSDSIVAAFFVRARAGSERYRDAEAALSSRSSANPEGAPDEESVLRVKAARAELEAMRKQVARIKAEFSAGKRY